ncbi:MAG TPA: secretin N-terminal domain-containing protein [Pyrinomonadaceae bacterium]|nr:secretin N-terminal domain-containing protein [Pyrinomonadaceae bacterium]
MKISNYLRSLAAFALIVCLLTSPIMAAGKKGEKNFKQGMKHEVSEQWDKAAEEFALAVAANPANAEYRLHYIRALFNASQMMMKRGRNFAELKDYVSAYNAFRQAYGYDPVNELARSEMERMVRLQKDLLDGKPESPERNNHDIPKMPTAPSASNVKMVQTSYTAGATPAVAYQPSQQIEQLRDIKYTKVDLKTVIKDLAQGLDLNVLFDTDTFRQQRDVTIELKNVTSAQALDAIFLQEGLFFQKVGKRMILVASQNRRQNFQQLVLRTFYLANAKPEKVRNVLQQAIPPQPGRPPTTAIVDEDTNSLTVRDTAENIKLIGNLIKSLDKDRAEVVMDVNIYEVSKSDLLNLGVQIGNDASLNNLGGTSSSVVGLGGNDIFGRVASGAAAIIPKAAGVGIILPPATIQAFQRKDNTRLLASTQVHAFNNEESQARIGQRVPVQTAQLLGYGNNPGTGQPGGINNNFNNAASVINYEQVGLTLKFTPIVFPNQDVQVKMSIESKDVLNETLTPTFTERSISGTARIQNNRTMLLASVAQDAQSNGRQGLPLLGMIPILGRLFTAPRRSNRTVDIVIAVTPRILRAPTILPEDESERETGSIAVPTNSSLADMIRIEDQEDQLAAARRLTNNVVVQLPDAQLETVAAPGYVPAPNAPNGQAAQTPVLTNTSAPSGKDNSLQTVQPRPIDSSIKTLRVQPTSDTEVRPAPEKPKEETTAPPEKP